jgi:hypothetical protein
MFILVAVAGVGGAAVADPVGARTAATSTAPPTTSAAPQTLTWSDATLIDTLQPFATGLLTDQLVCPSQYLCLAGDSAGLEFSPAPAQGGSWQSLKLSPRTDTGGVVSLSCPTVNFCAAVMRHQSSSGSELLVSARPTDGSAWRLVQSSTPITAITCTGPHACLGEVGSHLIGSATPARPGARWQRLAAPAGLAQVNCFAAGFCLALNGARNGFSSRVFTTWAPLGGRWRSSSSANMGFSHGEGDSADAVSCPSSRFCLISDAYEAVVSRDPLATHAGWSRITSHNGPSNFPEACTTTTCVDFGNTGPSADEALLDTPAPGAQGSSTTQFLPEFVPDAEEPYTPTCAPAGLCVFTDIAGSIWANRHPGVAGSAWRQVSLGHQYTGVADVSCVAAGCVAADDSGALLGSAGPNGPWSLLSRPAHNDAGGTVVACSPDRFCVHTGGASSYDLSTHTLTTGAGDAGYGATSASCPSRLLCVIARQEDDDVAVSTNPDAGSAQVWTPVPIATNFAQPSHCDDCGPPPLYVSCPDDGFCVLADPEAGVFVGRGEGDLDQASAWSQAMPVSVSGIVNGIACPSETACLLSSTRDVYSYDPATNAIAELVTLPRPEATASLSCTSVAFCVAVAGSDAYAGTATAGNWTQTPLEPGGPRPPWLRTPPALTTVSCVDGEGCVVFDDQGYAFRATPG